MLQPGNMRYHFQLSVEINARQLGGTTSFLELHIG